MYIICFDIDDNNIKIEEDMNYDIEMEKVILYQEDVLYTFLLLC